MLFKSVCKIPLSLIFACVFASICAAQQTNPVDRQVANPITDTPNINPVAPTTVAPTATPQPQSPKQTNGNKDKKSIASPDSGSSAAANANGAETEEVEVISDRQSSEGESGRRVVVHAGNVDVRFREYRLQADKITLYEETGKIIAEGSVVFDQGDDQRITGARAEWNYRTKLGWFEDSTGFTNQTDDGTVIYFTADRVERIAEDEIVVRNGKFTACEEAVPRWSFTAKEASIRTNDRVKLKRPKFRLRDIAVIQLPFATIPIEKRDRQSGFLTPTFGYSANKGVRLSAAYYQTLGRSADVTFRGELYSARGIGFGLDARTRANSRSYFNFGFFAVKDRLFGRETDAETGARLPDQGGSLIYADGVHYFSNGWTAAADVRLTSNLSFRQVFSDSIQQVISPIEVSKVFVNKSWDAYSFNAQAKSEEISIPNVFVKTRNLPNLSFEKRPTRLKFLGDAYFSFKTVFDGVSRRERVNDPALYRRQTGGDPIVTQEFGKRFDIYPQISVPFATKYFNFTATAGLRLTHYTNSLDALRQVTGRDITRKYGEFEFDVRPVALAKNYYADDDTFSFRHTIEPYFTYRLIKGVNNFNRIIRYDYTDTFTDTNEIEYGVTNRIFARRYTEAVTEEAQKLLREKANASGSETDDETNPLSVQPYEILTLTVRQKYFFDETFGEALTPGRRNQIAPITQLTFYTFGGTPRRFSPLSVDGTYRPRKTVFVNTRLDVGVHGDGLRAISATVGYDRPLLKIFQTFYYTRAVTLMPSLQALYNTDKEPGTLRGSQWSPSIFLGSRDKGWFGGTSLFFDFQNSRERRTTPLISSLYTLGYASNCCAVALQAFTYNVGVRRENRYVFSFRLNGIGTFGTEQLGQGLR